MKGPTTRKAGLWFVLLLTASTGLCRHAAALEPGDATLDLWPEPAREQLLDLIGTFGGPGRNAYAVFDADNTLWANDLETALLPYAENKGRISLVGLDPSLKPIRAQGGETMYSYYRRLKDIDHKIGMLWCAKAFSGLRLVDLRGDLREMMASGEPIPTTVRRRSLTRPVTLYPPRVYPAQAQLVRAMMHRGIKVYVVTAALEELVRMIASDPAYGIGVPPENVIGVDLLLTDPRGSITSGALERREGKQGRTWFFRPERLRMALTPHLYTPAPFYAGKLAAIKEYIHPDRRPIFVAGDSPNDQFMLFYCDAPAGGVRLFVRADEKEHQRMLQAILERRKTGRYEPADPLPEDGWLIVTPEDLSGRKGVRGGSSH